MNKMYPCLNSNPRYGVLGFITTGFYCKLVIYWRRGLGLGEPNPLYVHYNTVLLCLVHGEPNLLDVKYSTVLLCLVHGEPNILDVQYSTVLLCLVHGEPNLLDVHYSSFMFST